MKYKWCAAWCMALFLAAGSVSYGEEVKEISDVVAGNETLHGASLKAAKDGKKEESKEKVVKTEGPSQSAKPEALHTISAFPLYDADFTIRGISLGDTMGTVTVIAGHPDKEELGAVRNEYQWKDFSLRLVSDLAYKYGNGMGASHDSDDILRPGVDAIAVTGSSVMTPRGLTVGSSRENVLRVYGKPARILWDGPKNVFYFVYEKEDKSLVFTIGKDKVERILVTRKDPQFEGHESSGLYGKTARMSDHDFRIAGFSLGTVFHEYTWLVWEKKAMNPEEEVWYYPGFAVRMDKKTKTIEAAFLTDARMLTYRGITIGDQVSTLEALYGEPEKLEMNSIEGHPQSAYIYFSPDQKNVLIFYVDQQTKTVQNVLVMGNPQITNPFQAALDKVSHVRAKNHAEKV